MLREDNKQMISNCQLYAYCSTLNLSFIILVLCFLHIKGIYNRGFVAVWLLVHLFAHLWDCFMDFIKIWWSSLTLKRFVCVWITCNIIYTWNLTFISSPKYMTVAKEMVTWNIHLHFEVIKLSVLSNLKGTLCSFFELYQCKSFCEHISFPQNCVAAMHFVALV